MRFPDVGGAASRILHTPSFARLAAAELYAEERA